MIITMAVGVLKMNDAYFWDELGVYSKGALYLFDNCISLLPNAMPPELSRGHPLLAYVVAATGFKLFGPHVQVAHAIFTLIAMLTVCSTFFIGRLLFNGVVGGLAAMFLAVQPIFLAQTGLVLPEMILAFTISTALFYYFKKKWLLSGLFLSLAVVTKETSIIVAGFICLHFLIFYSYRQESFRLKSLYLLLPFIILMAFLIVQKSQNGWYFFPYHTSLLDLGLVRFKEHFSNHFDFVFFRQRRQYISWAVIVLVMGSILFLRRKTSIQVVLLCFIIIGTLIFFGFNFYMDRYLLYLYPLYSVMVIGGLSIVIRSRNMLVVAVIIISTFTIAITENRGFRYDVDLGYRHVIKVQKQATNFLEETNAISVASVFPFNNGLTDNRFGFLTHLESINDSGLENADYAVELNPGNAFSINAKQNIDTAIVFESSFAKAIVVKINR